MSDITDIIKGLGVENKIDFNVLLSKYSSIYYLVSHQQPSKNEDYYKGLSLQRIRTYARVYKEGCKK